MTTSSEAAAGLVSELRTIAEYVCWDKFEDRFISDPKKHPAWRAADALAARDARIAELEAAIREKDEALRPFARVQLEAQNYEYPDVRPAWGFNSVNLHWGDFRRARAAQADLGQEVGRG